MKPSKDFNNKFMLVQILFDISICEMKLRTRILLQHKCIVRIKFLCTNPRKWNYLVWNEEISSKKKEKKVLKLIVHLFNYYSYLKLFLVRNTFLQNTLRNKFSFSFAISSYSICKLSLNYWVYGISRRYLPRCCDFKGHRFLIWMNYMNIECLLLIHENWIDFFQAHNF